MANTINSSVTSLLTGGAGANKSSKNSSSTSPNASAPTDKEVSKDLFLKLMMAQLKNQNPLNPIDGTDFLSQLSQVTGVEQLVAIRHQLDDIHTILSPSTGASGQKAVPTP